MKSCDCGGASLIHTNSRVCIQLACISSLHHWQVNCKLALHFSFFFFFFQYAIMFMLGRRVGPNRFLDVNVAWCYRAMADWEMLSMTMVRETIQMNGQATSNKSATRWLQAKLLSSKPESNEDSGFNTIRLSLPLLSSMITVFLRLSRSWMWIKICLADSIQYSFTLSVGCWRRRYLGSGDGVFIIIVWRWLNSLRVLIYKTSESTWSSQKRMRHTWEDGSGPVL